MVFNILVYIYIIFFVFFLVGGFFKWRSCFFGLKFVGRIGYFVRLVVRDCYVRVVEVNVGGFELLKFVLRLLIVYFFKFNCGRNGVVFKMRISFKIFSLKILSYLFGI